jgi:hypothetical protein
MRSRILLPRGKASMGVGSPRDWKLWLVIAKRPYSQNIQTALERVAHRS